MDYKDLKLVGKIWYLILLPIVLFFTGLIIMTGIIFTFLIKIFKVIGLVDAFRAWASAIGKRFIKNK